MVCYINGGVFGKACYGLVKSDARFFALKDASV